VGLAPAVGCDAIPGRDRVVDPAASGKPKRQAVGACLRKLVKGDQAIEARADNRVDRARAVREEADRGGHGLRPT
jgi:hypothetical protein